jgi:hypothetical protein
MRNLVRALLLGLAAVTAAGARGDQAAPPAPPAPAAPGPAATPVPPPAADIEDFVPSEKVGADDAVSFPVDI